MAIRRCPECNYKIPDQPQSCPKCGSPFTMNSAFNDVLLPDIGFYASDDDIYTQDTTVSSNTV